MIDQKLFKERVKQAYITLSQSVGRVGPRGHANAMPQVVYDLDDKRDQEEQAIKRLPSAADISEMDAIFDAIIAEITNEQHRIQYQTYYFYQSKKRSISGLCKKKGWNRRTLDRRINKYDQKLMKNTSLSVVFRHHRRDLQMSKIEQEIHPQTDTVKNSAKRANHWRTPDARGTVEKFGMTVEEA